MPRRLAWLAAAVLIAACSSGAPSEDLAKPRDPASVAAGAVLYEMNCSQCHGPDLEGGRVPGGGVAPSLASKVGFSDAALIEVVKRGRGLQMPAFASQLEEGEIISIIDFVRSVQAAQVE